MKNTTRRILFLAIGTLAPVAAHAQRAPIAAAPPPPPTSISTSRANEPSAADVVAASLRFFRVHPDVLDGLRTSAHTRALLPSITAAYHFDNWAYLQQENLTGFQPHMDNTQWNQQNNSGNVEATWDLANLAFNPDEISVYSLVAVQRDVIVQITQTYFARRQLLLRLDRSPPEDAVALEAMQLRVLEFTATLDALTGGWFTRTTRANAMHR